MKYFSQVCEYKSTENRFDTLAKDKKRFPLNKGDAGRDFCTLFFPMQEKSLWFSLGFCNNTDIFLHL